MLTSYAYLVFIGIWFDTLAVNINIIRHQCSGLVVVFCYALIATFAILIKKTHDKPI